jgi:HEAT repeat protein
MTMPVMRSHQGRICYGIYDHSVTGANLQSANRLFGGLMSRTGKLPKGVILAAAASLALLISQDLLIGKPCFQNPPVISLSAANSEQNQEFEDFLKALRSDDSYERQRAAIALGKSGNPAAIDPLIKALTDEDTFVRSFSAVALGNFKDPRVLDPLIKALEDGNQRVRRSAAEALGSLRNPNALDPLVKLLNDENVFVRRSAAQALGDLGNPKAVDPLMKALGDRDDYIRTGASIALTAIGSAGIPKLVNALGDWTLGPRVAEILKSLSWQPASDEEIIRYGVASRNKEALSRNWATAKKVLISDANSGNSAQAENAVYALIGIGQEETIEELAAILRTKGNLEMAGAFLESGNARLSELARNWAAEHGKVIKAREDSGIVKWGEIKPE